MFEVRLSGLSGPSIDARGEQKQKGLDMTDI